MRELRRRSSTPERTWPTVRSAAAPKPPGFHTTTRDPKRAHLRVPAFKKTPKIQLEDPREREDFRREKEKKGRNFGRSRGGAVRRRAGPREGRSGGGAVLRRLSGGGVVLGRGGTPTRAKHVDKKKGNINKSKTEHTAKHSKTQQNTQKNTQKNTQQHPAKSGSHPRKSGPHPTHTHNTHSQKPT